MVNYINSSLNLIIFSYCLGRILNVFIIVNYNDKFLSSLTYFCKKVRTILKSFNISGNYLKTIKPKTTKAEMVDGIIFQDKITIFEKVFYAADK